MSTQFNETVAVEDLCLDGEGIVHDSNASSLNSATLLCNTIVMDSSIYSVEIVWLAELWSSCNGQGVKELLTP